MKGEILRFEMIYQARRVWTWLYFAALVFIAFVWTTENHLENARNGEYFLHAPYVVAEVTLMGSVFWILAAAFVAGDAAARDVETRMFPLICTTPLTKLDYLGGRFLAAFVLNASILLALPAGILLAVYSAGVEAEIRGPFPSAAYLTTYAFLAVPNAFIATAFQFSFASLGRRAVAAFLGGLLLLLAYMTWVYLAEDFGLWTWAKLMDPVGLVFVSELFREWTTLERNTLLIGLDVACLANRLLWVALATGVLALIYVRRGFRLHPESAGWSRMLRRRMPLSRPPSDTGAVGRTPISTPRVRQTFGWKTSFRQTLAIAWTSFVSMARSRSGLFLLALVAFLALASLDLARTGVPLRPRSDLVLRALTIEPGAPPCYLIIPLIIVFWSGELVWREREAGVNEIVDAAPIAEGILLLGKFLGLGLLLALCMALRMAVGILVQLSMGYHDLEIGLYVRILFGIQLASYLLLAMLALVVHVVVNQKHVGHLAVLVVFVLMVAGLQIPIGHDLLVPGSGPEWSYTDMRGFGPSLGPWLWYKLYWASWALMLAVVARLLWVRSTALSLWSRLRLARRRMTGATAGVAATAAALILILGGFIFYNTNVLNEHRPASDRMEQRAEYEHRYGQYRRLPQPRLTGVTLHVEIYPERRVLEIQGTYHLVNRSDVPIDSIHLATEVEPRRVAFDRPASCVLEDRKLGHRIYDLAEPLEPGGTLQLTFEVPYEPRGFRHDGVETSVVANGTFFWNDDWLPAIGYQPVRELRSAGDRRAHGLPPRPALPSLEDVEARSVMTGAERITFEAVVGTDRDQVAVAPGMLRETWREGGRRYFRYSTDAPIGNQYAFFSADYAVREDQWADHDGSGQVVAIQIFHDPGHAANVDRMIGGIRASLDYYTEQFGPYPHRYLRFIEHPGHDGGLHSEATTISHDEVLSLFRIEDDPRGLDLVFFGVAHEVAHQWWGAQLSYAYVEGAGVLTESLAQYSAMKVLEEAYGREHLRRFRSWMREPLPIRPVRATVPLLRADNPYLSYRKGAFVMYAVSEYIGADRVNEALRRLLEEFGSGEPPLPTSLDLYRELQAVTPDTLHSLLYDLFEANTFWELETVRATAAETDAGTWQVTLDLRARKIVVDAAGRETEVPIDDWVQVGVFAVADEGDPAGEPQYLELHHIRSPEQTITVTVPDRPARAGIDPNHLLIDWETADNVHDVTFTR